MIRYCKSSVKAVTRIDEMKSALLVFLLLAALAASAPLQAAEESVSHDRFTAMAAELGLRESNVRSRDLPGWRKPTRVVARVSRPEQVAALQAVAPGVEIIVADSAEQAAREAASAQVLLGYCDEEILSQAPELHWVQVYSSGVDRCVVNPGMHSGSKLLTNGQRISSPALAEHAIAMMMTLARGLDVYHANQLEGSWKRSVELGSGEFMELEGRTVLVVGLGGIGSQAAKRAHGLGMRVVATRGSRREGPDYVEYVGLAGEVNDLAAQADVVINTAPLTERTRGMFDSEFFAAMKPTAYFISIGRGASTVTDDLVTALKNGELAGAGLDVTDPEPLPEGHPLWIMPRVIISPHTGGRSDKGRDRLFLLVQENLRRYVAGEALYSVVDIKRGY
ncbi:MAG: D-2-hydroxyacid dehydrogenase [Gammaproteobacteria bacterium]|nr:D-2-hydroxyacid dehydrogenase [Gammaproteobacteria bacterium]